MMRDNPRRGRRLPIAVRLMKLVGLTLELSEVRTWRERPSRHARSFRKRPMSAYGPKEALFSLRES
jgi:hypothetical protein